MLKVNDAFGGNTNYDFPFKVKIRYKRDDDSYEYKISNGSIFDTKNNKRSVSTEWEPFDLPKENSSFLVIECNLNFIPPNDPLVNIISNNQDVEDYINNLCPQCERRDHNEEFAARKQDYEIKDYKIDLLEKKTFEELKLITKTTEKDKIETSYYKTETCREIIAIFPKVTEYSDDFKPIQLLKNNLQIGAISNRLDAFHYGFTLKGEPKDYSSPKLFGSELFESDVFDVNSYKEDSSSISIGST